VTLEQRRFEVFLAFGLVAAILALAVAALTPAKASAFGTFSNGVLTIPGGEGKIVPRCESDNEITVSGAFVDNGPVYCRDLKRIVATSDISTLFDFSQLPADLGGGQGPITIEATSTAPGGALYGSNKFIGAAQHINVFTGGAQSDSMTGGDLNDILSGGAGGDAIDGGAGNDTLRGGKGGDKLTGGLGADSLFGGAAVDKLLGGPGSDILKGGAGNAKLVGGPGKNQLQQ
jgi:hypothetical protein